MDYSYLIHRSAQYTVLRTIGPKCMRLPVLPFSSYEFLYRWREGSVTSSGSIGLSQPAASERFESLSAELVLSFLNGTKPFGDLRGNQFLQQALALLEDAVRAEEELLGPPNALVGDLDIGASTTIGNYIFLIYWLSTVKCIRMFGHE